MLLTLDPVVFLYLLLGILMGVVVGAIPGLTATMAVTVLLPVSFFLPAHVGIPFLIAVTKGAIFGGSIPAILISTPGTGAAAATVLDGYPLARQGKARKALEVSLVGSTAGDAASDVVAISLAGVVAGVALRLGPPEMVLVMVLGLALISVLSGPSLAKGFVSAGLGVLLGAIGIDPFYGVSRMTFGSVYLSGGLGFIPIVIGLYAISEVLIQRRGERSRIEGSPELGAGLTRAELRRCVPVMWRSFRIGMGVGMMPALGQVVAAFLAYGNEKRRAEHPEEFGKGALEGVAAAETANNSVNGPTMIPLLSFGIPGDPITAVLLAALLVQGLSPGPRLFVDQGATVYALLWAFIWANAILFAVGWLALRHVARLASLPSTRMIAVAAMFSFVGVYAVNFNLTDVGVMVIFGALGFTMLRLGIPREPLLITFLLAPGLEASIGQALALGGGPGVFVQRPLSLALLAFSAVAIGLMVRASKRFRQYTM